MKSMVYTQKVSLKRCKKILVKVSDKEEKYSAEPEIMRRLIKTGSPLFPEIYGIESRGNQIFMVEEFVYGISLDGILRGKGLPIGWASEFTAAEITEIGVQVCRGLRVLHGINPPVIHGDIKPENILLTSRHPICIKIIDCDDGFVYRPNTCYAVVKGTPGFCAPEQSAGAPCDFTVDIYALGRTLMFLLYGCSRGSWLKRKALKKIIKQATAEPIKERYVTVREMEKELRRMK